MHTTKIKYPWRPLNRHRATMGSEETHSKTVAKEEFENGKPQDNNRGENSRDGKACAGTGIPDLRR